MNASKLKSGLDKDLTRPQPTLGPPHKDVGTVAALPPPAQSLALVAEWVDTLIAEALTRWKEQQLPTTLAALAMCRALRSSGGPWKKRWETLSQLSQDERALLRREAVRQIAENAGPQIEQAIADLHQHAVLELKPLTPRTLVGALPNRSKQTALRGIAYAEVFFSLIEAVHSRDPSISRSFTWIPAPRPQRTHPVLIPLEHHVRQTLHPLFLPDAYSLIHEDNPTLDRAMFLQAVLNQSLLPLFPDSDTGRLCIHPPLLEPWEIALHVLSQAPGPLSGASLQDRCRDLISKNRLRLRRERTTLQMGSQRAAMAYLHRRGQLEDVRFLLLGADEIGLPVHLAARVPRERWPSIQEEAYRVAREHGKPVVSTGILLDRLPQALRSELHDSPFLLSAILRCDEFGRFTPATRKLEYEVALEQKSAAEPEHAEPGSTKLLAATARIHSLIEELSRYPSQLDLIARQFAPPESGTSAPLPRDSTLLSAVLRDTRRLLEQAIENLSAVVPPKRPTLPDIPYFWGRHDPETPEGIISQIVQPRLPPSSTPPPPAAPPANPYRAGSKFHAAYAMLCRRPSTSESLRNALMTNFNCTSEQAMYAVYAVLSPRAKRSQGDPRGSRSAQGHTYFVSQDASNRWHVHARIPPLLPLKRKPATTTRK